MHTAGNGSRGGTASSGICGRSRATESIVQLFKESAAHIVGGNVDSVSNTHDNKRALAGHRQTRIRCVQSGSRGLLDFANASTSLTNDGADENVRDEETEGVSFR